MGGSTAPKLKGSHSHPQHPSARLVAAPGRALRRHALLAPVLGLCSSEGAGNGTRGLGGGREPRAQNSGMDESSQDLKNMRVLGVHIEGPRGWGSSKIAALAGFRD